MARRPLDQSPGETSAPDLREILDDELAALPSRYRGPLVLCELEGLSRHDAALRLAIREGTLSSRLARGKARLRERLARRGFEPPGGAVPFVLIREATATMLSDRLIDSTAQAAMRVAAGVSTAAVVSTSVVSLTEGVLKSMLLSKIKGIALIIGSSVAIVSGGVALGQTGPGLETTRPDGDRMTVMERKLDRIIDALDRMTGSTSGSNTVTKIDDPAGLPKSASAYQYGTTDHVPRVGNFFPARDLPKPETATKPASGLIPPGLAERLESVERDLNRVHQFLAQAFTPGRRARTNHPPGSRQAVDWPRTRFASGAAQALTRSVATATRHIESSQSPILDRPAAPIDGSPRARAVHCTIIGQYRPLATAATLSRLAVGMAQGRSDLVVSTHGE